MFHTPSFWYGSKSLADKISVWLLKPFGAVYGWAVEKRFEMHYPIPLDKPIICVGNLVAGGAGKTPVVLSLSEILKDMGYNPHYLTRGYGGTEEGPWQVSLSDTAVTVGDEAILLAEVAPTWVARYRPLGAQYAIDSGSTVIIMDDGLQNPLIYKDFSLVVVDGGAGFGNGEVFPAGPLRESIAHGLSRTQAVVIVGEDTKGVRETVLRYVPEMPILTASLVPCANNPDVREKSVFAFAGIGRPKKFKETLLKAGAVLEGWGEYPDHFEYLEEDLTEMMAAAYAKGALVVTTAKDYVRLPKGLKERVQVFHVQLVWDEPSRLVALIQDSFQKRAW